MGVELGLSMKSTLETIAYTIIMTVEALSGSGSVFSVTIHIRKWTGLEH